MGKAMSTRIDSWDRVGHFCTGVVVMLLFFLLCFVAPLVFADWTHGATGTTDKIDRIHIVVESDTGWYRIGEPQEKHGVRFVPLYPSHAPRSP
mgnify:CR=1 FL=1